MAQYSRPSPDNARVVTDDDFEQLALGYCMDGIIGDVSGTFPVYADSTGRQVKIRAAKKANVRGVLWGSDLTTDEAVATTTNTSGNPRIDRLVLRMDRTTRNVRSQLITGTPSTTPAIPALTQNTGTSGAWDFPLARWQVASGYTTIAATDIVPEGWYVAPHSRLAMLSTWADPQGAALRPGMEVFEYDSGFSYRWNGAKWLRNEDELLVIADQAWTNTTTYSGVTAANMSPARSVGFGFPVDAGSRYSFEARLLIIGPNSVGLAVRTQQPGSSRTDLSISGYSSVPGVWWAEHANVTASPNSYGNFGGPGTTTGSHLRIAGTVSTGNAGNFFFEFSQGTANAGQAAWLLVGSSLRHRQVS